jgi:tRNA A37 threonylcarbamoyladenosine synthetase subunit TsaC/SUA5/YrdC
MGILFKIKGNQFAKYQLFFQHTLDDFETGKLLVLPLDSCYAFAGNPFFLSLYQLAAHLIGPYGVYTPALLVDSIETADHIATIDPFTKAFLTKFWPGNLTVLVPMKPLNTISLPLFQSDSFIFKDSPNLALHCSNDPVIKTLFALLKERHLPPMFFIVPVAIPDQFVCNDVDSVIKYFGFEAFATILDEGKLQKSKPILPNTIVKIENKTVQILQAGTISEEDLSDFITK